MPIRRSCGWDDVVAGEFRAGYYVLSPENGGVINLGARLKVGYAVITSTVTYNYQNPMPWGEPFVLLFNHDGGGYLARHTLLWDRKNDTNRAYGVFDIELGKTRA